MIEMRGLIHDFVHDFRSQGFLYENYSWSKAKLKGLQQKVVCSPHHLGFSSKSSKLREPSIGEAASLEGFQHPQHLKFRRLFQQRAC
jgi:hypothetical protein